MSKLPRFALFLGTASVLAAVLFAAREVHAQSAPPSSTTGVKGAILAPAKGNCSVPASFAVDGVVTGRHRRLWLFVRIEDRYWPKKPELIPRSDGKVFGRVIQGPGGSFELVLMDVPRQLSNEIDRWFQEGEKTGKWGGFDRLGLAEGDILDVVQCQRAASP